MRYTRVRRVVAAGALALVAAAGTVTTAGAAQAAPVIRSTTSANVSPGESRASEWRFDSVWPTVAACSNAAINLYDYYYSDGYEIEVQCRGAGTQWQLWFRRLFPGDPCHACRTESVEDRRV
ncbi:hypothetical protein [Streptomyces liangshanensis]|uniref:Uncharacterized protein n=1 Tax=Streptomyces liangshanensis TaxID=2717324 RepID=A0A6G9GTL7_9ACTN|nr:hypothetical protein [Streptomyces liangshanensis]QIQ01540.1 hypothetical protein HA039_03840 [Streptomyces liangshanensis]